MSLMDNTVESCNLFQLKVIGIVLSSISTASWTVQCNLLDSPSVFHKHCKELYSENKTAVYHQK